MRNDERDLLQLIAQSPKPVAMSDYFPVLNPAEPGMDENHPGHEAWAERQMAWYGVSAELWKKGLVHVVTSADGSHPDLVEPTDAGRAALA
ncbi:hypothetical protein [Streptomyces sp. NPDC050164]|uniref:hypothetical protein n=1 Tax=Streptomyces sp. NPDC050164 TaxID=3365605 RepID=UPI0037B0BEDE